MAGDIGTNPAGSATREVRRVGLAFFKLTGGFWLGETMWRAWFLTLALALSLATMTGVNVFSNKWQGWFFDALEKRNVAAIWQTVLLLPVLVFCTAGIGVCIVLSRETLQTRWREWITRMLIRRWLGEGRFHRLKQSDFEPTNPEYRIADDVRMAVEPITDLVIGLTTAVLSAVTFIGILWSLGGNLTFTVGESRITIPAYFVLAAVGYGILASTLIVAIGRSLVWKVAARNEAEAIFRATLTLTRDKSESIAARSSEEARKQAESAYETVVFRWLRVVRQNGHITWITNANAPMIATVPLLLAAPKYLSGEISLGDVVRIAAAFSVVQGAISWLVDNFRVLAMWAASARRVVELAEAMDRLEMEAGTPTSAEPGASALLDERPGLG